MKLKTNSTLSQLTFAIMLFSSCFTHSLPTPNKNELIKATALFQMGRTQNELVRNELITHTQQSPSEKRFDELVATFSHESVHLRTQVKHVKFVNNLHEFFALANDDTEISDTLARHFKVTVNGVEIPYAQERTIPVVGNSYLFILSIPNGKLSKVMVLGAALLKKSLGFVEKIGIKLIEHMCGLVNTPPSLFFRCPCKLEDEDHTADQLEAPIKYISDIYASHSVFQNNFNLKSIYQETRGVSQGTEWLDLHFDLSGIKH